MSKEELEKIIIRVALILNVARANYILYALIAKNVDQLRHIKGVQYLGNIQDNAKNICSLEIHKAYAPPQESKKEVASFGYVVAMLSQYQHDLNIQIHKKHKPDLIKFCQKYESYDEKNDIVNGIVKSYKILNKKKKSDLKKLKKVRHEFIAHSTLEQNDLKGPMLVSMKELISDGLEFAQMLYLVVGSGALNVVSEKEYLEQGKAFLKAFGLVEVEYFE